MIVHIGSTNPTKIEGASVALQQSNLFEDTKIMGVDAKVPEFGHPKTLEATIEGAKARATAVFEGAQYSVGLESGLYPAPHTKSGYLETTVCAIYDGANFFIGCGPSFEWPKAMVDLILAGQDGSQAFKSLGLTEHEKIGRAEGGIYILTHGKINRVKLNELAVLMALMQVENPELY